MPASLACPHGNRPCSIRYGLCADCLNPPPPEPDDWELPDRQPEADEPDECEACQ